MKRWYDGYNPDQHVFVVHEEFSESTLSFDLMKELIGPNLCTVPVKHGRVVFNARVLVLVTNRPFGNIWIASSRGARGMEAV